MYSAITAAYVVLLVMEIPLLLVVYAQFRNSRTLAGVLLAAFVLLLLRTPDSALMSAIGRLFPGTFGLYLASALYPQSRVGVIVYLVLVLLPIAMGWPWGRRSARPEQTEKRRNHRRKR